MDFSTFTYQSTHPGNDFRKAQNARQTAARATNAVNDLTETLDRLVLASKAMWELLREHADLTDDDLITKIREIDLRDGKLDGKTEVAPRECPGCGKPNGQHRKACLYCGRELPAVSPL